MQKSIRGFSHVCLGPDEPECFPIIAFVANAVTIPNGRFTNTRYTVNIGPPALSPKNPAPIFGRKNRNRAVKGAKTYKKPTKYSRFQAVFAITPNRTPQSPPQNSGL